MKTFLFGLSRRTFSSTSCRARGCGLFLAAAAASTLLLGQALRAEPETDENLEASARGAYVFRKLLAEEALTVEASHGILTLRGSVAIALQRELAEEAVAALPGVKSIDNQIVVKASTPDAADELLALRVRTVLGLHRSSRPHVEHLQASAGVVTLRGQAESEAQRALAAEHAADVDGVETVRNELTLPEAKAPHPQPAPGPLEAAPEVDDPSVVAQVRMALRAHRSTRSIQAAVQASEGVVTLTGHVASAAERDLVGRICSDVLGVRRLENRLIPEPESTEN